MKIKKFINNNPKKWKNWKINVNQDIQSYKMRY